MALNRTQTIELSVASNYIAVKDTTPIEEYNLNGITDPVLEVEDIEYIFSDEYNEEIVRVDITSSASDLRSADGLKIYFTDIGLSDSILDDIYVSKMIWTFSGIEYPSETKDAFYSLIKNKVANRIILSDWKDISRPISFKSYSKYTLKLKSMLDSLIESSINNLYEEYKIIHNNLNNLI